MISSSNFFFVDRFPSEPLLSAVIYIVENQLRKGSTESWTGVFGFIFRGANHFPIEPAQLVRMLTLCGLPSLVGFFLCLWWLSFACYMVFSWFFFHWSVSFLTRCVNFNLQQWTKSNETNFLPRFGLGFLNSDFKLLASKPYPLLGFKGSLCCVSCVWCGLFCSWPTFVCQVISSSIIFSWPVFWATIVNYKLHRQKSIEKGSTESWTRVFGLKVQVANHYTIQPTQIPRMLNLVELPVLVGFFCLSWLPFAWYMVFSWFFFHWAVCFLTRCVKSNLIHNNERKVMKQTFYQDLVSIFWIQSSIC